jgi:ABC-2 type transport system permease protein
MSTTGGQDTASGQSTTLAGAQAKRGSHTSRRRQLTLVGWQVLYEQRSFWRNRRRAVSSFAFPLMFLVIFGAITHGARLKSQGNITFIDFYVPGIIAYAVMVIGFTSMAMGIALLRESGVLKRMRTTPMPWSAYLAGVVLSTVVTVIAAVLLLLLVGVVFYGANLRSSKLPGLIVTIVLGTACFTSLGIAVSRFIPKPDSGMPMLMFIVLPLSFVSNVFFPLEGSKTLEEIGKIFPLRPLAEGLAPAFHPAVQGAASTAHDLRTLLVWTVFGCFAMVRTMRGLSSRD